jgi:hypothetical protein
MNVERAVAALSFLALALGHATIGRWVLPRLTSQNMRSTPFGPPSLTLGMIALPATSLRS